MCSVSEWGWEGKLLIGGVAGGARRCKPSEAGARTNTPFAFCAVQCSLLLCETMVSLAAAMPMYCRRVQKGCCCVVDEEKEVFKYFPLPRCPILGDRNNLLELRNFRRSPTPR